MSPVWWAAWEQVVEAPRFIWVPRVDDAWFTVDLESGCMYMGIVLHETSFPRVLVDKAALPHISIFYERPANSNFRALLDNRWRSLVASLGGRLLRFEVRLGGSLAKPWFELLPGPVPEMLSSLLTGVDAHFSDAAPHISIWPWF